MKQSVIATARVATEPRTTRLDLYVGIHKALRACMADALVRVGRLDATDPADRDEALAQLEEMLDFCTDHVRHEDEFMHPELEARLPSGSSRAATDHVEHRRAIDALRREATALRRADPGEAEAAALRLYRHLSLFVADSLQHLHFEETTLNTTLWSLFTDAELESVRDRLYATFTPEEQLTGLRWMLPAVPPADRAAIAAGMKGSMPPEALLSVLVMIRPALDPVGWKRLAAAAGVAAEFSPLPRLEASS